MHSIFPLALIFYSSFPNLLLTTQRSVSTPLYSPEIQNLLSQHRNLDFHKNLKLRMSKTALNSPPKKTDKAKSLLLAFPQPQRMLAPLLQQPKSEILVFLDPSIFLTSVSVRICQVILQHSSQPPTLSGLMQQKFFSHSAESELGLCSTLSH